TLQRIDAALVGAQVGAARPRVADERREAQDRRPQECCGHELQTDRDVVDHAVSPSDPRSRHIVIFFTKAGPPSRSVAPTKEAVMLAPRPSGAQPALRPPPSPPPCAADAAR